MAYIIIQNGLLLDKPVKGFLVSTCVSIMFCNSRVSWRGSRNSKPSSMDGRSFRIRRLHLHPLFGYGFRCTCFVIFHELIDTAKLPGPPSVVQELPEVVPVILRWIVLPGASNFCQWTALHQESYPQIEGVKRSLCWISGRSILLLCSMQSLEKSTWWLV